MSWFDQRAPAGALLSNQLLPPVAPSSVGSVRYPFNLGGSLSSDASTNGGAGVQLNLRQSTGPVFGLGRVLVRH